MGTTCCNRPVTSEYTRTSSLLKNQVMEYSKNIDIRKHYEFLSVLGSGSFGKVRLYRNIAYKELKYAVKTLKKDGISKPLFDCFKLEVNILRGLDHPNIVKYYETFEDEHYLHIVMEYLQGDDLAKIISHKKHNKLSERDMCLITKQLLKALVFIHQKNIVHRDIKPENVLFRHKEDYSSLKLIDFGLATTTMRKDRKSCGSPYYMSPEIINGHFCPKTDVWAVGVILFLMITGKYPFDNEPRTDIFENIVKKPVDVKLLKKSNCTNEAIDLIQKLLEKEIDDRLSASAALEHSWFDKFELNNNECLSLTMDTIETLRDFSNKTTFQKEVLFFIAKITEEDEIKKLRQMFEEMDTVNTGYLTKEEMKDAIESKKIKISHNDLERIWDGLDFHKTGKVNYTEFLAGMISGLMKDKEEKLQSAFNFFENTEDEGYISYSSLLQVIKSFDLPADTKNLEKIFHDSEGNNKKIDFETFKELFSQK